MPSHTARFAPFARQSPALSTTQVCAPCGIPRGVGRNTEYTRIHCISRRLKKAEYGIHGKALLFCSMWLCAIRSLLSSRYVTRGSSTQSLAHSRCETPELCRALPNSGVISGDALVQV